MAASHIPPGKRYVLLDNELADMIEAVNTSDLTMLLELLGCASGQERRRWTRPQITITARDGRKLYLVGRLRNKQGGFM